MVNCISCSALLPVPSTVCEYCGRRNDVDLQGIHHYTVVKPDSERVCPCCELPLQTINLRNDGKFYIERCEQCMGLFFDSGELEALLEQSVSNVFDIDRQRLNAINKELYQSDIVQRGAGQALYVRCPVCNDFMQRRNFGAKSGVIADRCMKHGVWLDGGELRRLMEWKKAGGQLLHEKMAQEKTAVTEKKRHAANMAGDGFSDLLSSSARKGGIGASQDDSLLSAVFQLVDKLF